MTGRRPRRGLLVVVAAAVGLHLLSRVTEGAWLSLASAAVAALAVVALLTAPRLAHVRVSRTAGDPVAVGEQVRTLLTVGNTGRRTSSALLLRDDMPGHEPRTVAVPALPRGGQVAIELWRTAQHRTSAGGGCATLTATSPFGLFRSCREQAIDGRVVVHPARVPVPVVGRRAGGGDRQPSRLAQRPAPGQGSEVLGLRPWRPGDPARTVSARATARHGRLVVIEREPEPGRPLVLLVGKGAGPAWERALSRGAALAVDTVRSGCRLTLVGLVAPPRPSATQVLDAFAAADRAPALGPGSIAAARLAARSGGTVVLVAGAEDPTREPAMRALAAAGCPVMTLDGGGGGPGADR